MDLEGDFNEGAVGPHLDEFVYFIVAHNQDGEKIPVADVIEPFLTAK